MTRTFAVALLLAAPAAAQTTDPFPTPIATEDGAVTVGYREFAALPDIGGDAARPTILFAEPGTQRLFVNDMTGHIYTIAYGGGAATEYLNIDDPKWGMDVNSGSRELGFQSFAVHPQFAQAGSPGYGKLYTWADVTDTSPPADFTPEPGGGDTHDTVLLEWTARTPSAATYDGGPPREVMRVQQPYRNHNGGQIAFNPNADPGDEDYGLLYVGNADGGSGGDPQNMAQNMGSAFGKILRIDPLGRNSRNGKYGIPQNNPFVGRQGALGEIYALGVRNPQRFAWDPSTGAMYVADIGQNIVEEMSPVPRGGNLGWNVWEGSFRYLGSGRGRGRGGVGTDDPRGDPAMVFPVAEYDHSDPVLVGRAAATGLHVYRGNEIPQLRNRILFGDNPSGEVFHVSADQPPDGGQAPIRRVLLHDGGQAKTLLQLIQAKNTQQGKQPASRADLRFGSGPNGEVFLLNKQDGTVRLLVPTGGS